MLQECRGRWERRLEREDELAQRTVVDEKCATQYIAADESDDSLAREICTQDPREFALETDLWKANRCWVQRLDGLSTCGPDRHRPHGRDVQRLEDLSIDCRHTGPGVDEALPSDRRGHWLALLLEELHQVRMERDLDWKDRASDLKRLGTRLPTLSASRLREDEGVMDGHVSGRD